MKKVITSDFKRTAHKVLDAQNDAVLVVSRACPVGVFMTLEHYMQLRFQTQFQVDPELNIRFLDALNQFEMYQNERPLMRLLRELEVMDRT
jgi:hypothetical protein